MFIRGLYTLILLFLSPYFLYRLYRKKTSHPPFGPRWKEHFGITPKLRTKHSPLWIHAVSVGESVLAASLVKKIKCEHPEQPILVTTTTSTGAAEINKLGDMVEHRYMPVDFGFAIKRFLKTVAPSQMLIIETELWPNTLHHVSQAKIPVTVVNARLSEKSFKNYKNIQPLFRTMIPTLHHILCQTESDANRFIQLGIQKEKIIVTGSVKFDINISEDTKNAGKELRETLGKHRPVWIAASTHKGEDEQILEAHRLVLRTKPDTLLILVPRHPERFDSVFQLCSTEGFNPIRRTSEKEVTENYNVYLGDTMGEMLILLGAADICFMGGSLLGEKVGGHNVLEPVALGVPTITGPSFYNFKQITEQLLEYQAIYLCHNAPEISNKISQLLNDESTRHEIKNSALKVIQQNQGALEKTLQWIQTTG